jgi:hypothetical protein
MFGQFFVDPEDADPVELLDGVEVVDPDELFEVLPPVAAVVLEVLEVALDVLVAALATKAPPATRPLVSAPAASTLRRRSFMNVVLFHHRLNGRPDLGNQHHPAGLNCVLVQRGISAR